MADTQNEDGLQSPGDFKSPEPISDIKKIFESHNFFDGRMIGGSKSFYRKEHDSDVIVFNANVVTKKHSKVFYGDINVTLDGKTLKEIASCVGETLYILPEFSARFGNEDRPINTLLLEALWNTDMPVMNYDEYNAWVENNI